MPREFSTFGLGSRPLNFHNPSFITSKYYCVFRTRLWKNIFEIITYKCLSVLLPLPIAHQFYKQNKVLTFFFPLLIQVIRLIKVGPKPIFGVRTNKQSMYGIITQVDYFHCNLQVIVASLSFSLFLRFVWQNALAFNILWFQLSSHFPFISFRL